MLKLGRVFVIELLFRLLLYILMFAKIDRKPSDENLCFFVFFVALPIEIMLYNILDMSR